MHCTNEPTSQPTKVPTWICNMKEGGRMQCSIKMTSSGSNDQLTVDDPLVLLIILMTATLMIIGKFQ